MAMIISKPIGEMATSMEIAQKQYEDRIRRTVCNGFTDDEFEKFKSVCNKTKLDPESNQICAIPKDGKMVIITRIDGYRAIADRTGRYMPGKECTFTYDKNNMLLAATAYVKKLGPDGQWHEVAHTVFWKEYAPMKDGQPTRSWRNMPHVMLGKCAEAGVLRKAFPADLSGLYTDDEMEKATIDVTPQTEPPKEPEATKQIEPPKPEEIITKEEADLIESLIHEKDSEYRNNLLDYFTTLLKSPEPLFDFYTLPKKYLDGCMKSVKRKAEERKKIEEAVEMII